MEEEKNWNKKQFWINFLEFEFFCSDTFPGWIQVSMWELKIFCHLDIFLKLDSVSHSIFKLNLVLSFSFYSVRCHYQAASTSPSIWLTDGLRRSVTINIIIFILISPLLIFFLISYSHSHSIRWMDTLDIQTRPRNEKEMKMSMGWYENY